MKKELFDELLKSVKQGGEIMKRTMKPARTFTFAESEVKKNRGQYGLSQDKFAILELAYSKMSKDRKRESEALKWAEATFKDTAQ